MKVGQRFKVCGGSGLDSDRVGTVIPRSAVKTDGRGVPLIEGHYKPMGKDEVPLRDEEGNVFTMFKNRLIPA